MLIECSFCHAQAKIAEDKEGAKVRCSECGKVYVAHEKGSRGAKGKGDVNPVTLGIGIGAVVVIAIFAFLFNNRKPKPVAAPPPPVVKAPEVVVDATGWDSELVRMVRSIYDGALGANEDMLANMLDGARIATRVAAADPAKSVDFAALDVPARLSYVHSVALEMIRGEDEHSPHFWKPVDGRVASNEITDAVVRVTVDKRMEPGTGEIAESRTYDWKLTRPDDKSKWKVWSWERYLSPDEIRALKNANRKKVTKVTLEDGSSLFQAEMRHIDDYPDTTSEQHAQVEKAIATMLDFSLRPKENNLARDELVAIGKHAVPQLLNKFHEIKIVDSLDDPSLTQLNMVDGVLRSITGYPSSFSALPGQTEERRTMALKAWFAWYERKGKNFTAPVAGKDLLEEIIVPTERDKREIEKEKAKGGGR